MRAGQDTDSRLPGNASLSLAMIHQFEQVSILVLSLFPGKEVCQQIFVLWHLVCIYTHSTFLKCVLTLHIGKIAYAGDLTLRVERSYEN